MPRPPPGRFPMVDVSAVGVMSAPTRWASETCRREPSKDVPFWYRHPLGCRAIDLVKPPQGGRDMHHPVWNTMYEECHRACVILRYVVYARHFYFNCPPTKCGVRMFQSDISGIFSSTAGRLLFYDISVIELDLCSKPTGSIRILSYLVYLFSSVFFFFGRTDRTRIISILCT